MENAVEIIKDNIDIIKILEYYKVDNITQSGSYLRCPCPIHKGDSPTAFSINTETTLWRCFTNDECGGGDIFTFIEKMENVNFVKAVKILANILGIDLEGKIIAQRKTDYQKELENWLKYINRKRKSKKDISEYSIQEEVLSLKKYRHFSENTLNHFKAGYSEEISYYNSSNELRKTYKRIVCPIFLDNIQIGVSLRKTKASEKIKWLHLPTGIAIGNILYNLDACKNYDEIIIVEGIFDVWSYYEIGIENVVCVFGSKITEEQYKLLFKTGKDIILSFDGDDAGAKATKQAIEMFKNKTLIYRVKFEEGEDPGSLSPDELLKKYNGKERVL